MKKNILMGDGVSLDVGTLVDTRLLVTGNSGCGKSWTLRLIAEQVATHVPTIVIDPEGEYPSLREKIDAVLVSDEGDVTPHPKMASKLARRLLELNVSAVVDIQSLKLRERRAFVRLFLEGLMSAPRRLWHPVFIMLDEAHKFAPERSAGKSEATESVITLMCQGRKRGFAGILATQRLSKLHKDAAAEAVNNLVGRTTLDVDVNRALDVLGLSRSDRSSLRRLKPGAWFGFGPSFRPQDDGLSRFQAAEVTTTHPKSGQRHMVKAPAPSAKIKRVVSELEDLPREAEKEARDLESAKAEIGRLKRDLRSSNSGVPSRIPEGRKQAIEAAAAKRATAPFQLRMRSLNEYHAKIGSRVTSLEKYVGFLRESMRDFDDFIRAPVAPAESAHFDGPSDAENPTRSAPGVDESRLEMNGGLVPARQRIVDALRWMEVIGIDAADRTALAFLAGTKPSSSAYGNNLGAMRSGGLIDYPAPGRVQLTDEGRAASREIDAPLTSGELHRMVYAKLTPSRVRILRPLVGAYPGDVDRSELAHLAGTTATSSAYGNNLGAMRTAGLIEYPGSGRVAASRIMFLGHEPQPKG